MRTGAWASRRGGVGLAMSVAGALTLSGCSVVPIAAWPTQPSLAPEEIVALDLQADRRAELDAAAALLADTATAPDGFDAMQRMAVRVRSIGCGELSIGSGFAIDEHTLITNRHVVANSLSLEVSTYDGQDIAVTAANVAMLADLAVVTTEDPLPQFSPLAETDAVIGEPISVVGYPLGRALTVTSGRIIGDAEDPLHANLGRILLSDAAAADGSSGSPALNAWGQVVGVVYALSDTGESMLVPVSTLRDLLENPSALHTVEPCE